MGSEMCIRDSRQSNAQLIKQALERAGVILIDEREVSKSGGAGVRLNEG